MIHVLTAMLFGDLLLTKVTSRTIDLYKSTG